jgi:hypothetical protein
MALRAVVHGTTATVTVLLPAVLVSARVDDDLPGFLAALTVGPGLLAACWVASVVLELWLGRGAKSAPPP